MTFKDDDSIDEKKGLIKINYYEELRPLNASFSTLTTLQVQALDLGSCSSPRSLWSDS
jgi:hypothetical protein